MENFLLSLQLLQPLVYVEKTLLTLVIKKSGFWRKFCNMDEFQNARTFYLRYVS